MQVCTSLQTDNHANTPPLSFLQAGCPSCRPTNSVKAQLFKKLKGGRFWDTVYMYANSCHGDTQCQETQHDRLQFPKHDMDDDEQRSGLSPRDDIEAESNELLDDACTPTTTG